MPLEVARVRVPGWTVVEGSPASLPTLGGPTLVRLQTGVGHDAACRCVAALASVPVEAALLGGFAGALAPDLDPGTVVVADSLLTSSETSIPVPLAESLEESLLGMGLPVARGPLISVDQVVGDSEDKSMLWRQTGALAVDMESAFLAEGLLARGLPFGVARVVLDSAQESLPASVSVRATLAMLARPSGLRQLPDLIRVGSRIRGCAGTGARVLEAWLRGSRPRDAGALTGEE